MEDVETPTLEVTPERRGPSILSAIEEVVRKASYADGLAIGLKEVTRAIETRNCCFVVLAENCDVREYRELVEKLCFHCQVDLVKVPDKNKLGLWAGLGRKAMNFQARTRHICGSLAVTDFGEESEAAAVVLAEFKKQGAKNRVLKAQAAAEQ